MEAAGLPRGVFYPDGDGSTGTWMQIRGGSNGQSSMIQFFDVVLGVHHTSKGNSNPHSSAGDQNKETPCFHDEVRDYMPAPHRRFLLHISRMGSIRELANLPPTSPEQESFCAAYTRTTEALVLFRNKHIGIVTRYIVLPSQRAAAAGMNKKNLATVSANVHKGEENQSNGETHEELKGTGGTSLIPFLKQTRDETLQAGILERVSA
jgi:indoleamine 2,3-dioxygenase